MVLLRRHGATVAGRSLRECVFRSVYSCRNAELQSRALAIGTISTLSPGEAELCSAHSHTPRTLSRTWEYWTHRLAKAEAATAPRDSNPAAKTKTKPKTSARRGNAARNAAGKAAARPAKRATARPAPPVRKAKRAKRR
jgi:HCOMODA/2-hydroxy-3-carboxy-muconic semialdehyde decarboxylase